MKTLQQNINGRDYHHQLYAGNDNQLPLVLVYSTWAGITAFEQTIASRLNVLGYDVVLVDVFSQQVPLNSLEERRAALGELMADMNLLQQRLQAFEAFIETAAGQDYTGLITSGYCFGGFCSLLSGFLFRRVQAATSFHALLKVPASLEPLNPNVRLLVLNGYKDPMVSLDEQDSAQAHFDRLGLDWTMINYGRAMHSFALPHVQAPENGTCHDAIADRRSWQVFVDFIQEA